MPKFDVRQLLSDVVNPDNAFSRKYFDAVRALERFPENDRGAGESMFSDKLSDSAFWEAIPWDSSGPRSRANAYLKLARNNSRKLLPYIQQYDSLRTQGASHNDALDVVMEQAQKDPGSYALLERVFNRAYVGNRRSHSDLGPEDLL